MNAFRFSVKQFALILAAILSFYLCHAQKTDDKPKQTFGQRLVFGGNLGLSFGTLTYIEASPTIGYRTTDRWINGAGVTYIYWRAGNFSNSIYGGSLFSRYLIADNFIAHAEYQVVNLNCNYFGINRRQNVPHLWVGGGYHTGRSQGLGLSLMLLYDLIQDPCSPFQNPSIRVGVNYRM